jgi:hypothetical protein
VLPRAAWEETVEAHVPSRRWSADCDEFACTGAVRPHVHGHRHDLPVGQPTVAPETRGGLIRRRAGHERGTRQRTAAIGAAILFKESEA